MLCRHGRQRKSVYDGGSRNPIIAGWSGWESAPAANDRTSLANSSKSLMNQRCAACSRFTKSVNKRKKKVESVNEANALEEALSSMMFYVGTIALLLAKTEHWMMVFDFLIIEEHFLRAMIFRN